MFSRTVNPYNPAVNFMWLNDSSASLTTNDTTVDFLSNGFKPRVAGQGVNSATVYFYMAWAAEPHLEARHKIGFKAIIYLIIITLLAYLSMKKIWSRIEPKV